MSRCFPFPPPGYEKKAKIDDTDLLEKEKQKDKRHRKDKKEKEKRESKEKRDKDSKKEKHREKKDRKEKHKDKDKSKDKGKDKNRTLDGIKVEGQPERYNGEKFGSNSLQNTEIKDSIYVEDLARRIRDENRASGSQMFQKVVAADQRRVETGEMVGERDQRRGAVQTLLVERSIGNQSREKERDKNKILVAERSLSNQTHDKERVKNKTEVHRKVNGRRKLVDTGSQEKSFGQTQNCHSMDQEKVEEIVKLVEKKDDEKHLEDKQKSDSRGEKHKVRDQEKNKKSKDKDMGKEAKKEKAKEITEPIKEQHKLKDNVSKLKEGSKDPLDFRNNKSEALKLSNVTPAAEANLGKRKELERNGSFLDHGNRPIKFPRHVPSSQSVAENGKKLEPCQSGAQSVSVKQGLANSHNVDFKEQKFNGSIKAEQKINGLITTEQKINGLVAERPHISSVKSLAVGVLANENGEAFSGLPHPDTKYLSKILSIPGVDELPGVDDQDWLLGCNHLRSTKPSRGSPGIDGTQQVWAEALWLDSADISALPYVIPY